MGFHAELTAKEIYDTVFKTHLGKVSAISKLGNLQVLQGLSYFFPTNIKAVRNQPILEVGAGIGTITRILLQSYKNDVYCYELDQFCLNELRILKKNYAKKHSKRLHVISNLDKCNAIDFFAIIIDGPISKKELSKIIKSSNNLKFIAIENYRLLQRFWVTKLLYKAQFRQQYIEIRHDFKPTATIFFVEKDYDKKLALHLFLDFANVVSKIFPKLVLHSWQSKGKILKIGKYNENGSGVVTQQ
jgi:phospholipid N-methyltransferase